MSAPAIIALLFCLGLGSYIAVIAAARYLRQETDQHGRTRAVPLLVLGLLLLGASLVAIATLDIGAGVDLAVGFVVLATGLTIVYRVTTVSTARPVHVWSLIGGLVLVSSVGSLLVGDVLSSSRSVAKPPSVARLASEASRSLYLNETPAPGNASWQLGFGDAVGGRQTFPYSGATTTTWEPTFNSIVDTRYAPYGGDERQFLSLGLVELPVAKLQTNWPHRRRSVALSSDEAASVLVLIENSAAPQPNCNRLEGVTIAENSHLRAGVWNSSDGKLHVIRVWLFASNTNPRWVTDAVAVTTDGTVELELDPKLSYVYSKEPAGFDTSPALRSKAVLQPGGMPVGHGDRGLIGSCWENRFFVVLLFQQKDLV